MESSASFQVVHLQNKQGFDISDMTKKNQVRKKKFGKRNAVFLLCIYQIFIFLQSHIHFFFDFDFTFMENLGCP